MKKWKLFVGLILVFLVGVAAGSLGDRFLHKQRFERMRKDPATRKAFFLKKLSRKLNLTEGQKRTFEPILDQVAKKSQEHRMRERAQMKEIITDGFSQMRRHLTPDQQKKLDELQNKARRFMKRHPLPPSPSQVGNAD